MRERRGSIGILVLRHVKTGWADNTVLRQDGRQCRGCRGRRGMPLPEGYQAAGGEGGAGQ